MKAKFFGLRLRNFFSSDENQQSSKFILVDDCRGLYWDQFEYILMVKLLLNTEVSMDASERCFPMCQELQSFKLLAVLKQP